MGALTLHVSFFVEIDLFNSTLPKKQVLDSCKLKEFAKNNFKFDENGRKCSKQVANAVEKGEIARYKQFLPFKQCFQKTCTAEK